MDMAFYIINIIASIYIIGVAACIIYGAACLQNHMVAVYKTYYTYWDCLSITLKDLDIRFLKSWWGIYLLSLDTEDEEEYEPKN